MKKNLKTSFVCQFCNLKFKTLKKINIHLLKEHKEDVKHKKFDDIDISVCCDNYQREEIKKISNEELFNIDKNKIDQRVSNKSRLIVENLKKELIVDITTVYILFIAQYLIDFYCSFHLNNFYLLLILNSLILHKLGWFSKKNYLRFPLSIQKKFNFYESIMTLYSFIIFFKIFIFSLSNQTHFIIWQPFFSIIIFVLSILYTYYVLNIIFNNWNEQRNLIIEIFIKRDKTALKKHFNFSKKIVGTLSTSLFNLCFAVLDLEIVIENEKSKIESQNKSK